MTVSDITPNLGKLRADSYECQTICGLEWTNEVFNYTSSKKGHTWVLDSPHPAVFVCQAPTGRVHTYSPCACFPVFKQMNRKEQIIAEVLGLLFLHHVSLVNRRQPWLKTTSFTGCETRAGRPYALHCCCPAQHPLPLVGFVCGLPVRLLLGRRTQARQESAPTCCALSSPVLGHEKAGISSPDWRCSLMWNWDCNRLALV